MSEELEKAPSFGSRLGQAMLKTLRVVFILVIVVGIGAIVYFGVPYLYEKIIYPIENNTERLTEIENTQLVELDESLSGLQNRLDELEKEESENRQNFDELQGKVDALAEAIEVHNDKLDTLAEMQASLDALVTTSAKYDDLLIGDNSTLATLNYQVKMSRAIELLSRARLYLSQSNFGLVKADVEKAKELLIILNSEMPSSEKKVTLGIVIERLNLASANLPDYPVIAVDSVDIAWQLLVDDLPTIAMAEHTLVPTTPEATATAEP